MHPRHSRHTMLKGLMAASVLLAGLSACSNGPEPIIEPSPSQTPTADPPDSPTVTPEPEPESAKAFIRRWQAATHEMQISGKTADYRSMTHRCSDCDALVVEVTRIYGTGGTISATTPRLLGLRRVDRVEDVEIFEFKLRAAPMQVLSSNGQVERDFPGGEASYQVNVERRAGQWKVLRISQLVS